RCLSKPTSRPKIPRSLWKDQRFHNEMLAIWGKSYLKEIPRGGDFGVRTGTDVIPGITCAGNLKRRKAELGTTLKSKPASLNLLQKHLHNRQNYRYQQRSNKL